MALHVQTTDDIDENCIYVNHSFLFILGEDIDGSELDLKKPTLQRNSIFYPPYQKLHSFSHLTYKYQGSTAKMLSNENINLYT